MGTLLEIFQKVTQKSPAPPTSSEAAVASAEATSPSSLPGLPEACEASDTVMQTPKASVATVAQRVVGVDILSNDILTYCDMRHIIQVEGSWLDEEGLQELLQRPRHRVLLIKRLKDAKSLQEIDPDKDLDGIDLNLAALPYEILWEGCLDVSAYWHAYDIQHEVDGNALRKAHDYIGQTRFNSAYHSVLSMEQQDIHIHGDISLTEALEETAKICFSVWLNHLPQSIRQRVLLKYPPNLEMVGISSEDIHFLDLLRESLRKNLSTEKKDATENQANRKSRSEHFA